LGGLDDRDLGKLTEDYILEEITNSDKIVDEYIKDKMGSIFKEFVYIIRRFILLSLAIILFLILSLRPIDWISIFSIFIFFILTIVALGVGPAKKLWIDLERRIMRM